MDEAQDDSLESTISAVSTNNLSFDVVDPVHVRIEDLSVSIETVQTLRNRIVPAKWRDSARVDQKAILNSVDAQLPAGSLTVILGGSGSGKTTLLNSIAHRVASTKLETSGNILYNGSKDLATVRSAYVMQQDILIPSLTVRETLQYAADLRLPTPSTKAERYRIVEKVILELGLKECADTRIGDNIRRGCSGGEKRRTSIGVQILANPSLLFLDEPTTGLDATSALHVMATLKHLSKTGRTVVASIHQPRSEIWNLLEEGDRVILLSQGSPVYIGTPDRALRHFEEQGHVLPTFVNPAEYLIDLAAVDIRSDDLEAASQARVESLKIAWRTTENLRLQEKADSINPIHSQVVRAYSPQQVATKRQFAVLTRRGFKVTVRDPMGLAGSMFEAIGMAVLTGWIFYQLDGSLSGIRSREGALYNAASLQGYLILLYECYRLTIDIQLFDREHNEGVVGVGPFLLSRRVSRFLLEDLPVPLFYSIIYYFMVGLQPTATSFFIFFAYILATHYIAVCLGMVCVSISRDFAGASLVANLVYTLQSMCCGYFVQPNQIPPWTRWLKWTAYLFYSFGGIASNEFIGVDNGPNGSFYSCPYSDDPSDPVCKEYTGRYIMDSLGLPSNWIWRPLVILCAFACAFYLGAWLLLHFWRVEISVAAARKGETDRGAGKERVEHPEEPRTILVKLAGYSLNILKRDILFRRKRDLSILKPLNITFEPRMLNVVLGPSGSGKTSLLHSVAGRLHSTVTTKYVTGGSLLFNGAEPSPSVLRSVAAFVVQDDDALMASLTVKETLHFSALIRLPEWMSKEEKIRKADEVMVKLGLRDVANNVIGNDLKKGISGGEKRRVSIAIQILTDPKILFLDEPTSGLDAFTALSIIEVLQALAEEGRTVIMTVHQARSDIFPHFGNVLLLARGGSPVYAGRGVDMLDHFASLGYECPSATNPADFFLDQITVDLQHEVKEAITRAKVKRLIESWNSVPSTQENDANATVSTPSELGQLRRQMNPWRVTLPLVLRRSAINLSRQPDVIAGRVMQVISMGLILSLFFAPMKHNYPAVQTRMGLIQEFAALYFVGMLQNISLYPYERDVFYREEDDGAYSVEVFLSTYSLLEIPFEICTSVVFGFLAAYAINMKRTIEMALINAFNVLCIVSCGESVGILFNTFFGHVGFSVQLTSIMLSISTVLGGIMSLNVPSFLQALNHLSPIKYAIANLAPYAMEGQYFTCSDAERLANGQCPISTGKDVLDLYNLDKSANLNLMGVAVCTVVYRIVAYAVLKLKRTHWDLRYRKSETFHS